MYYNRTLQWIVLLTLFTTAPKEIFAQDQFSRQLEEQEQTNDQTEQDLSKLIGIDHAKKKNINAVTYEELQALHTLTLNQINSFFEYKRKFGDFLSMYELQAIPEWDIPLIKEVMKWFSLLEKSNKTEMSNEQAQHQIVFRIGRSGSSSMLAQSFAKGMKQTFFYRNNNHVNTAYGLSAEKDAGEKNIFDFTSGYLQKTSFSIFKKLIVGDYLITMGQGMIHWHGYAFGKGSNILSIMRQSVSIKPHTGTEENRFFRGMGFEIGNKNTSLYCFVSKKGLDANIVYDSIRNKNWVSSLLLTGLHRNEKEWLDKKSLQSFHTGFILKHQFRSGHIALNGIYTHLNIPIQKRSLPYNTYSIKGDQFFNLSSDFAVSGKWGTFFGELAADRDYSTGAIIGFLKNLHRTLDVGMQWRRISKSYNAFAPNIIAHQYGANNESGLYIGMNYKLNNRNRLEAYIDQFIHPFPVFSANGPQRGLVHALTYTIAPTKKWEIYLRLIEKRKTENLPSIQSKSHLLSVQQSFQLRIHAEFQINEALELRIRNELLIRKKEAGDNLHGWLSFAEIILHPVLQPYSISIRTTYFNTDGFDASIYSMERDLPQYYSMQSFFNRGNSSYLLFQTKISNKVHLAGKWVMEKKYFPSSTPIPQFNTIIQSEWRVQATIKF